jgi:hypothetical protein
MAMFLNEKEIVYKAMFESWVLEGKGGEWKVWEEVNPRLGVLKK